MLGRKLWAVFACLLLIACGGDDDGSGGAGGTSSGTGTGTGMTGGACSGAVEEAAVADCSVIVESEGADDTTLVQTALIEAVSGDTVCFCPATYMFEKELSLTVTDVTVKGVGATRDDVVFDFTGQTVGDDGFTVTSDGFAVENLWLKNTPGNGIVVTGVEGVRFSNIKVSWDAGSVTENGAYAVYPVKSKDVLVENSEIVGAADAGIYVGQCENALVRDNVTYGNVAGIEIENTLDSEVVGNEAYDNTAGILVFVLPNLENKEGMRAKIHMNNMYDNNRGNFAEDGTIVSVVPPGLGMLVLASDETEIHDNTFSDNDGTSILLVSYSTVEQLSPGGTPDPMTDPYLEGVYIHDNTFMNNGTDPKGALGLIGATPLEDVVWDGEENPMMPAGNVCLGDNPPSFRSTNGTANIGGDPMTHTTDPTPHMCMGTVLSTIDL